MSGNIRAVNSPIAPNMKTDNFPIFKDFSSELFLLIKVLYISFKNVADSTIIMLSTVDMNAAIMPAIPNPNKPGGRNVNISLNSA